MAVGFPDQLFQDWNAIARGLQHDFFFVEWLCRTR